MERRRAGAPGWLTARRYHHHVYVIELSPDVLYEARFKRANPDYLPAAGALYAMR
ncbi:hypothetical protein [Massilia psychrophila]|uniref:hypothetical protein n=1 Tax=Massilia psychrophila TaxID=1603353 RepID=UPI0015D4AB25|nr:hypothetical protein [Massilia psychrophila]